VTRPPAAPAAKPSATPSASPSPLGVGRVVTGTFHSAALNRTMPYTVYLPPGYDADPSARFPTLYMLHGGSGSNQEWVDYGLLKAADLLMGNRTIPQFIIALPQGDQEYWVDHITSQIDNGEKWGTYLAKEVVPQIDGKFRTYGSADARAIGGLSMGGHAAMQLPMNFPGIWSVIGAHSPSLRAEADAPTYLGRGAEFAARDPLLLITAKPDLARTYIWWIDDGDVDPWRVEATAIHNKLDSLGITNEWHAYTGDHSATYWSAHVADYLGYYGRELR
jgi:enterochelin esterase-like enzyme